MSLVTGENSYPYTYIFLVNYVIQMEEPENYLGRLLNSMTAKK